MSIYKLIPEKLVSISHRESKDDFINLNEVVSPIFKGFCATFTLVNLFQGKIGKSRNNKEAILGWEKERRNLNVPDSLAIGRHSFTK